MKLRIFLAAAMMLFVFAGCESTTSTEGENTTGGTENSTPDLSGSFKVDVAQSSVSWTGTKADKPDAHHGTLTITEGNLTLDKEGNLNGGTVSADMLSLVNTDEMPEDMKANLENHLKSADFFDVENFATATYTIGSVAKDASGTYNVSGKLSVRDLSLDVSFPATVATTANDVNASGTLKLTSEQLGFAKFAGTVDVEVKLVAKK